MSEIYKELDEEQDKTVRAIFSTILMLFQVGNWFLGALVFMQGWSWHVMEMGVPKIKYWQAAGLEVLVGLLLIDVLVYTRPEGLGSKLRATISVTLATLFAWFLLWVTN